MTPEQLIEICSRSAHETNRAYCLGFEDRSHVEWDETDEALKASVRKGVELVIRQFQQGIQPDPQRSHRAWMEYKLKEGWVLGPEKNLESKQHPNLVEWDQLPKRERMKDQLFIRSVLNMYEILIECEESDGK